MAGWFNVKKSSYRRNALWRRYQLGIYSRYSREGYAWENHLLRSKQRVLDFITRHSLRSITILGSGWLLDVPLCEMAPLCERIYLVDRYHPKQSVKNAQQFRNVELIECDVTGGLDLMPSRLDSPNSGVEYVKKLQVPHLPTSEGIVSLNLMSQLTMPLQERFPSYASQNAFIAASAALEATHIKLLSRYPCWLLITDTEERHSPLASASPTLRTVKTLVTSLPPMQNQQSWEWDFDTLGYYAPGQRVSLHVESGEGLR